jgi:hypothetical protein
MKFGYFAAALAVLGGAVSLAGPPVSYKKIQLSDKFYAEGAYYADFNKDGQPGRGGRAPTGTRAPISPSGTRSARPRTFDPHGYSDNFLTYTGDFNGDGWPDVLYVPYPGGDGLLVREPRRQEPDPGSSTWR